MDTTELKFTSRRHMIDKERAIGTAKNPKDSHYGRTLLRNNIFEGRLLSSEMGKLGNEARRKQMHLDQQKKLFMKKNLSLPDPTILVERPPSPGVLRKAQFPEEFTDDDYYFNENAPPHYMKPRSAQIRPPSTHVIMDMFKVTKQKKHNIWEEVLIEKEEPHFESAVRPARKLSELETKELQKAWNIHRRQAESMKMTPFERTKTASVLSMKPLEDFSERMKLASQGRPVRSSPPNGNRTKVKSVTFITQLPDFEDDTSVAESEGLKCKANSFKSKSETIHSERDKSQGQANAVEVELISVSLTALDNHKDTRETDESVKAPSTDIQRNVVHKSQPSAPKSNRLKTVAKPKVTQPTKKQKRRPKATTNTCNKDNQCITHTYKNDTSAASDKTHSSRARSPGSGKRRMKKAFLSLLVEDAY